MTISTLTPNSELVRGVPRGLELGLRNFWQPIATSDAVARDAIVSLMALGEALVVFRDRAGRPNVLVDRCPHRSVKLSVGRWLDGELQCALHGLRFGAGGRCTLIPWEPEDSPLRDRVPALAYPTEEIGGIIWAYLGDTVRFPAPPIAESVPEELLHPEQYVHFLLPTDVWDANWLLVVDGSDGYHAVTLHAETQHHAAVARYTGAGEAGEIVPLVDRRVKILDTEGHGLRGISVDRAGRHLDHGHRLERYRGERFVLPALFTNVLRPTAGTAAYVSRLFKVPVDYTQTRVFRYAAWRVEGDADRDRYRELYERVVRTRQLKTAAEDKAMAAACGDLVRSREHESLFAADRDVVRIRRRIAEAFLAQHLHAKRVPDGETTPSREALVFPI